MSVNIGGLDYTGKVVPSPSPLVLPSIAGFSDFFARGNHQINHLSNPFDTLNVNRNILSVDVRVVQASAGGKPASHATGKGTLIHKASGSLVYKGDFDYGFRHGVGIAPIYAPDGTYQGLYRGEWKFSMRHGMGEMTYPDGAKFQGEWDHDRKNGAGIDFMASGGRYFGFWRQDFRHGQGRFTWNICSQFEVREYNMGKREMSVAKMPGEIEKDQKEKEIIDYFAGLRVKAPTLNGAEALIETTDVNEMPEAGPMGKVAAAADLLTRTNTQVLPKAAKAVADAFGTAVKLTIDEPSFTKSNTASIAVWMLAAVDGVHVITPVTKTIQKMCADSFVKEVLQEKVKTINIVNGKPYSVTLSGTTLVITGMFEKGEEADLNAADLEKKITALL
eukprot:Phypoly_transcript_08838.p1 GENE.Phypoly_transcript_08838~~Phypoly_transcript_08838.p1  ORF type:complete len:390 (+),score=67.32 Phypoly_transcript_08838:282-1451(+)